MKFKKEEIVRVLRSSKPFLLDDPQFMRDLDVWLEFERDVIMINIYKEEIKNDNTEYVKKLTKKLSEIGQIYFDRFVQILNIIKEDFGITPEDEEKDIFQMSIEGNYNKFRDMVTLENLERGVEDIADDVVNRDIIMQDTTDLFNAIGLGYVKEIYFENSDINGAVIMDVIFLDGSRGEYLIMMRMFSEVFRLCLTNGIPINRK